MKDLEAKVADLLTETEFVINAGAAQGVAPDDEVVVWEERQVLDPDSSELLGTVRVTLARATVSEVQEKFSIVRARFERANFNNTVFGTSPRPITRFTKTIPIDADQVRLEVGRVITVRVKE